MTAGEARTSPYVGLVPYSEEDYDLFFGRREDIERVTANLFGPRLTLLYGRSGVGKSSLLNAGVLRKINDGASSAGIVFRDWSREDRFEQIVAAVEGRLREKMTTFKAAAGDATADDGSLEKGEGFARKVRVLGERAPLQIIILLDQFEDYFLYVPESQAAIDRDFASALTAGPANISYLLSIREDSLALLDRFKGLVPGLFDNYLRIDPLGREAAKQAIVKPLTVFEDDAGGTYQIEDSLVDAILGDLQGESAWRSDRLSRSREGGPTFEAALLQLVMQRLWEEEIADGRRTLRRSTYLRLNRSRAIVRSYLDRVMARLGPDGKRLAYRVFGELVTASGDKVAHRVQHLAERAFADPEEIERLLQQLVDERVLRVVDMETNTYEVYHDILAKAIRKWRDDYERETDPVAPARKSLERRLAHAVELATSDSREDQLQAIRSLTELGRSRVDPVIPERARAALRRIEKISGGRSFVDLGGARHVQLAARGALNDLELDRLVLSIQESLHGVQSSAGADQIGDFERDQIRRGVHTVDQGVDRLVSSLHDEDPSVRRSAFDATYDIYELALSAADSLSNLGEDLGAYEQTLWSIATKCAEAVDTGLDLEASERLVGDEGFFQEGQLEVEASSTNPWVLAGLSGLLATVLALLTFLGVEWLLDRTVADYGWARPPGAEWVLLAVAIVFVAGVATVAYDEADYSSTIDVLTTSAIIGALAFLVVGALWYAGNCLGVMAHSTFGFSLTWSIYGSLALVVGVTGGSAALGGWFSSL